MEYVYRVTDLEAAAGACGEDFADARSAVDRWATWSGVRANYVEAFGAVQAAHVLADIVVDLSTPAVGIAGFEANGYSVARIEAPAPAFEVVGSYVVDTRG